MLVATAVMGIAVVSLLSNISTSLRNGARLAEHDRAALVAKRTMDELLVNTNLPYDTPLEGTFDAVSTGMEGGWTAHLTRFELPPQADPGTPILERIELEVWWTSGMRKRTLNLEAYRRGMIPAPVPSEGGF